MSRALISLCLTTSLAACGNSPVGPELSSYQPMPANLTASRVPPLPGDKPGRLTYGEALLWSTALLELLRQSNCDKALIRQIELARMASVATVWPLPQPVECSLLNKD
jgi:hypothetical protein